MSEEDSDEKGDRKEARTTTETRWGTGILILQSLCLAAMAASLERLQAEFQLKMCSEIFNGELENRVGGRGG